jgi:3-oxoacyl-[acyl-carrier protein] reductase
MLDKPNLVLSGSSRGLGREMVGILRSKGYNVITMGFTSESEVDIRCDLLDLTSLKTAIKNASMQFGDINVLVCNAGTGKRPSNNLSENEEKSYFRSKNLLTAQNLLIASEPYLAERNCSVIGISSIVALKEVMGAPLGYREAKRALNVYFQEKAIELAARGIRVNVVSPGNIYFEGSRWHELSRENPSFVETLLEKDVPLQTFISPEEIAEAIVFLSSSSARNITGANLVIDGGQSL